MATYNAYQPIDYSKMYGQAKPKNPLATAPLGMNWSGTNPFPSLNLGGSTSSWKPPTNASQGLYGPNGPSSALNLNPWTPPKSAITSPSQSMYGPNGPSGALNLNPQSSPINPTVGTLLSTGNLADPSSKMGMDSQGPTMSDFMPDPTQSNPAQADPNGDQTDQPWTPSAEYIRRNAMVAYGMDVPMIDGFDNQTGLPVDPNAPVQGGQTNGGKSPPIYQFTMADILANMPDTAMPTMDQIQQDPGYKWRLDQGLNALQGSAAARGSLQSSGTMKDILDYSQGLASQEYDLAYKRFAQNQQFKADQVQYGWNRLNGDRSASMQANNDAFGQYMDMRNADTSDYRYADTTGYNHYMDQVNAYNSLMGHSQSNSAGLAGTGYQSAQGIADLVTNSASALAGLGMSQAQIAAMSKMASDGQNTDMIKSLLALAGVAIAAFA